jgi:3-hydroxybutyryl-CoA dehydrogenase
MTIAILADAVLKEEWLAKKAAAGVEFVWADSLRSLMMIEADAYFDLQYTPDPERKDRLRPVNGKPLFVNAVAWPGKITGRQVIRINAWPTLLRRPVTEIALTEAGQEAAVKQVFDALQWRYQLVPDVCGMITPRVLAAIVNEAYFTLGAEVSTKAEIDTAMKLGTNYPLGPFEWSEAIGLANIGELLRVLSQQEGRYAPAPALEKELVAGEVQPKD